jgi:hypothetical protein
LAVLPDSWQAFLPESRSLANGVGVRIKTSKADKSSPGARGRT